ncbi:MAG: endonuclease/exonuclease/phosphatase family protein [Microlunatus sp.]|nr:endonuclease/exonuclease/phosphatase family protein [Microlunatus sp.]
MRLVTFNLWSGRQWLPRLSPGRTGSRGRRPSAELDLTGLRAAIRRLDPDVLALQEVDRQLSRSGHADLTEVAAEAMGARDYRFVPALAGTPGAMWVRPNPAHRPQGAYGIALLSRYPVLGWHDIPLPAVPGSFRLISPVARRPLLVGEEPRAAMLATVDTPLGPGTVTNTHLTWVPGSGTRQLQQIVLHLATVVGPVMLMGDLNMWGRLPERITGYRPLARHRTYPTSVPRRQLDHILLRGDFGRVVGTSAVQVEVSDHRALVVDLVACRP